MTSASLPCVAYYRVSTKQQGHSGLGLQAQRTQVQQRTEGQSESIRDVETAQGRSLSHSYTERNRVRIQDVLELSTGEFYGQLVDADFSSFKA